MAHQSEIAALSAAVDRATCKIDEALDAGDRRDFKAWCRRRADLIARREKALVVEVTTAAPA